MHCSSRRELLLLATGLPALAQFSTGVQVVNVFVTVRDKQRRLVRNLAKDGFNLTEDGRKQPIGYFSAETSLPLTLGLLFDLSGSQRTVIPEQREAAAVFLQQMLRTSMDEAFLAGFNQHAFLIEPITADRSRLERSLRTLEVPRGTDGQISREARGSALLDALSAASGELEGRSGRKAIVVLSDGIDTASSTTLSAAIEALQRADVSLYPIRVYDRKVFAFDIPGPGTDNLREGKKALERMARETGGATFEVSDAQTLTKNFAALEDELRSQYSLGYSPPRSSSKAYRKIRVSVKAKGLAVQARDGYYGRE